MFLFIGSIKLEGLNARVLQVIQVREGNGDEANMQEAGVRAVRVRV